MNENYNWLNVNNFTVKDEYYKLEYSEEYQGYEKLYGEDYTEE